MGLFTKNKNNMIFYRVALNNDDLDGLRTITVVSRTNQRSVTRR